MVMVELVNLVIWGSLSGWRTYKGNQVCEFDYTCFPLIVNTYVTQNEWKLNIFLTLCLVAEKSGKRKYKIIIHIWICFNIPKKEKKKKNWNILPQLSQFVILGIAEWKLLLSGPRWWYIEGEVPAFLSFLLNN